MKKRSGILFLVSVIVTLVILIGRPPYAFSAKDTPASTQGEGKDKMQQYFKLLDKKIREGESLEERLNTQHVTPGPDHSKNQVVAVFNPDAIQQLHTIAHLDLNKLAKLLGMSKQELQAELNSGESLEQIAKQHGKTLSQVMNEAQERN